MDDRPKPRRRELALQLRMRSRPYWDGVQDFRVLGVVNEMQEAVIDVQSLPIRDHADDTRHRALPHQRGKACIVRQSWARPGPCGIHLMLTFAVARALDTPVPHR